MHRLWLNSDHSCNVHYVYLKNNWLIAGIENKYKLFNLMRKILNIMSCILHGISTQRGGRHSATAWPMRGKVITKLARGFQQALSHGANILGQTQWLVRLCSESWVRTTHRGNMTGFQDAVVCIQTIIQQLSLYGMQIEFHWIDPIKTFFKLVIFWRHEKLQGYIYDCYNKMYSLEIMW